MTGAQIERLRDQRRSAKYSRLSKLAAGQWEELLRGLDLSRQSIKTAMGFAFDKIECAEEIVETLIDRLIISSSHSSSYSAVQSPAVKMAGLFLLSDLLHNSGTPIKHATDFK
jgi:U2-associated protein SR140